VGACVDDVLNSPGFGTAVVMADHGMMLSMPLLAVRLLATSSSRSRIAHC
jgi:hypothetical protein